jgi:hypothetical protein
MPGAKSHQDDNSDDRHHKCIFLYHSSGKDIFKHIYRSWWGLMILIVIIQKSIGGRKWPDI